MGAHGPAQESVHTSELPSRKQIPHRGMLSGRERSNKLERGDAPGDRIATSGSGCGGGGPGSGSAAVVGTTAHHGALCPDNAHKPYRSKRRPTGISATDLRLNCCRRPDSAAASGEQVSTTNQSRQCLGTSTLHPCLASKSPRQIQAGTLDPEA